MKRILTMILAAVLLICQVISVSAEAPTGKLFRVSENVSLEYEIRDEYTCAITGVHGEPETLDLPETIDGVTVSEISRVAFMSCTSLKTLRIPGSVERIGDAAFAMCPSLTGLELNLGLKEIGQAAFYQCTGLERVILPETVSSVGLGAFGECSGLVSIRFPGNLETLENSVVSECSLLTEVILPEKLRRIKMYAFNRCEKLTELDLPETLEEIGDYAFYRCSGLEKLNLPQSLTTIGANPFVACPALQLKISETHPAFELKDHALFGKKDHRMIALCSGVDPVSSYSVPEGTAIIGDSVFNGISFLEEITIPEGVHSIGAEAFGYCAALQSIILPASTEQITGNPFLDCNNLKEITVADGNSAYQSINGVLYDVKEMKLQAYPMGKEDGILSVPDGICTIGEQAVCYCPNLADVRLPGSVTDIESKAFWDCQSLVYLNLPVGVKNIAEDAFQDCSHLTLLIPKDTKSVSYAYCSEQGHAYEWQGDDGAVRSTAVESCMDIVQCYQEVRTNRIMLNSTALPETMPEEYRGSIQIWMWDDQIQRIDIVSRTMVATMYPCGTKQERMAMAGYLLHEAKVIGMYNPAVYIGEGDGELAKQMQGTEQESLSGVIIDYTAANKDREEKYNSLRPATEDEKTQWQEAFFAPAGMISRPIYYWYMPHRDDGNEYDDLCNFIQSAFFAMGSCVGVVMKEPMDGFPKGVAITTEENLGGPCIYIFGNERRAAPYLMEETDRYTMALAVGWIWVEAYAMGDAELGRYELYIGENGRLGLYEDGQDGWLSFHNTVDEVLQTDYNIFGRNK